MNSLRGVVLNYTSDNINFIIFGYASSSINYFIYIGLNLLQLILKIIAQI